MAMHTQNLKADARASLLVTQDSGEGDPLGASRVTLVGNVVSVPEAEVAAARHLYLARHANSKYWVDFEDFSFYRLEGVDIYYVGGFGVMGWVSASEYGSSQPDPLADAMDGIIQHMNADHKEALVLLTRKFAADRSAGSHHDGGRPAGVSGAIEDDRGNARGTHRVPTRAEEFDGDEERAGGDGETGAVKRIPSPLAFARGSE